MSGVSTGAIIGIVLGILGFVVIKAGKTGIRTASQEQIFLLGNFALRTCI